MSETQHTLNLTMDNVTQPITEWAMDYGIPVALIRRRLDAHWPVDRAITYPMQAPADMRLSPDDMKDQPKAKPTGCSSKSSGLRGKFIAYDGKAMLITDWADYLGVGRQVIYYRLRQGYPLAIVLDGQHRIGKRPPAAEH